MILTVQLKEHRPPPAFRGYIQGSEITFSLCFCYLKSRVLLEVGVVVGTEAQLQQAEPTTPFRLRTLLERNKYLVV